MQVLPHPQATEPQSPGPGSSAHSTPPPAQGTSCANYGASAGLNICLAIKAAAGGTSGCVRSGGSLLLREGSRVHTPPRPSTSEQMAPGLCWGPFHAAGTWHLPPAGPHLSLLSLLPPLPAGVLQPLPASASFCVSPLPGSLTVQATEGLTHILTWPRVHSVGTENMVKV